jgi:hypothetical protein
LLYSLDGELLKHLDLPVSGEAMKDVWTVNPSPAGRYFVIEYEPQRDVTRGAWFGDAEERWLWIDAETLQVLRTWTERE